MLEDCPPAAEVAVNEPTSDALECISWEPMPAAAKAAALLAAAADDSGWEQHGPVYLGV
jgi:hypothetical protein